LAFYLEPLMQPGCWGCHTVSASKCQIVVFLELIFTHPWKCHFWLALPYITLLKRPIITTSQQRKSRSQVYGLRVKALHSGSRWQQIWPFRSANLDHSAALANTLEIYNPASTCMLLPPVWSFLLTFSWHRFVWLTRRHGIWRILDSGRY